MFMFGVRIEKNKMDFSSVWVFSPEISDFSLGIKEDGIPK